MSPTEFQTLLLRWFDQHGRKHLPWQQNKTPYRVWVSEIMLQQTQVSTVIPYFERFMAKFPDIFSLASAHEDEVLHLWAGLGYYSRARNLQRAARMIAEKFQGKFPDNLDDLKALPGVGPSTAGAILAIAFNHHAAILDGNVKRVLARLYAINEPINSSSTEQKLWEIAVKLTPYKRVADYTQAMMDLGATLCTRSKPACDRCPFMKKCLAFEQKITALLPIKKMTKALPIREKTFLILKKGEEILLQKRPPIGIWGGLFSLPEVDGIPEKSILRAYCKQHFNVVITAISPLKSFRHTFSHYHLDIHPVIIELKKLPLRIMEEERQIWYNPLKPEAVGLPKPVQLIMRGLV